MKKEDVELAKEVVNKGAEIIKNPNLLSLRFLVISNAFIVICTILYSIFIYNTAKYFWERMVKIEERMRVYETQIGIPQARRSQLRFENRGKDGWEAGKKFVIDFVKINHSKYWKNPTIYKSRLLLASQDVLAAEVNKSKMEFGVTEIENFTFLSVSTMQPFIKDIENWIEFICKSDTLDYGWQYDISVLFNINMSRWLEELHKLKILGTANKEKEEDRQHLPFEFVYTGEKRDYKNRKNLENNKVSTV